MDHAPGGTTAVPRPAPFGGARGGGGAGAAARRPQTPYHRGGADAQVCSRS